MATHTVPEVYTRSSNGRRYLSLLHLRDRKVNPPFFSGCKGSTNNVRPSIKNNDISDDDLLWVSATGESQSTNNKAQPFVTEEYANEWIINTERIAQRRKAIKDKASAERSQAIAEKRAARKRYDPAQLEPLPNLIELAPQFFDGKELQIETRGERTMKGVVFKALDVQKAFGTDRIYNKITEETGAFEYDVHYKFFLLPYQSLVRETHFELSDRTPKTLYLTYLGLTKYLFCSQSVKADAFQEWAAEKLFVHQLGDQSQKDAVASELIGVHTKVIHSVFRCSPCDIPCVYMFRIGSVKDLRAYSSRTNNPIALDKYEETDTIYKIGCTDNLKRRTKELQKQYGGMSDSFDLEQKVYVDKVYVHQAETKLKHFLAAVDLFVPDETRTELVMIPKDKMKFVVEEYQNIHKLFRCGNTDLMNQLQSEQHKRALVEQENQFLKTEKQILERENQYLKTDNEHLRKKDTEYMMIISNLSARTEKTI